MALGRKRARQQALWVATEALVRSKGHVFYERVNRMRCRYATANRRHVQYALKLQVCRGKQFTDEFR
jgi:hypothetical protein